MADELYGDVGQPDESVTPDSIPDAAKDDTQQAIMPNGPANLPQNPTNQAAPQAPTPPSALTAAPNPVPDAPTQPVLQQSAPAQWQHIANDNDFKKLSDDQQNIVRQKYYQQTIASDPDFQSLPPDQQTIVKQKFDQQSGPQPDQTSKFDKIMDVVNAPFAGITKGITETALGAGQIAGKVGNATGLLPNTWEQDINGLRQDADEETSQRYKGNPVASGLNTAGEFGEKVGEFGLLGGSSKAGYLRNMAAGSEQAAIQPAAGDNDRLLNTAVGGGAAGVGKYAGDTLSQLFPGEIPKAADLQDKAQQLYKQAEQAGGYVPSKYVNAWLDEVKSTVNTASSKAKVNPLSYLVDNLEQYRGKMMSYGELQKLDQDLGEMAHSEFVNSKGSMGAYGKGIDQINDILLKHVDSVPAGALPGGQISDQAKQVWMQSAKLRQVEKIIDRADLGLNKATSIRSGATTLLKNAKQTTAWSAEEKDALKQVATQGNLAGIAHLIGSRLNPIVWAAHSGPAGAAGAYAASEVGRGLAGAAQMAKAQQLSRVIGGLPKTNAGLLPAITNPIAPAATSQAINYENPNGGLLSRMQ